MRVVEGLRSMTYKEWFLFIPLASFSSYSYPDEFSWLGYVMFSLTAFWIIGRKQGKMPHG